MQVGAVGGVALPAAGVADCVGGEAAAGATVLVVDVVVVVVVSAAAFGSTQSSGEPSSTVPCRHAIAHVLVALPFVGNVPFGHANFTVAPSSMHPT